MENDDFAEGVYNILSAINYIKGGGHDFSTGIDYRNEVFETHSFWAHCDTCTCGFEEWSEVIDSAVMERMKKYPGSEEDELDSEWWRLYNMEYGNVTQGELRTHDDSCGLNLPGFHHFETGLSIRWYKRVGRSTESNKGMKTLEWYKLVVECLESVRDSGT